MNFLISTVLTCLVSSYAVSGCCPYGWLRYDDSCYLIEDVQLVDWHDAQKYCENLDSHLVKPETDKENNFLRQMLKRYFLTNTGGTNLFWIGGNDIAIEHDYVWVSNGGQIDYFDWGPYQPSSDRQENCICYYRSIDFAWNDESCLSKGNFICEIENMVTSEVIG